MAKNLVIVESPAKAKTIERYLGKDFVVRSSFGHVRDLSKKGLSIDVENNFEPNYVISPEKKQVVSELKKLAKESEVVWLATDEDREGEAISWHLFEALNLKNKDTRRISFNEITNKAVLNAIENPREINQELVNAQQARRVLDRVVGFELSPVLWRKVKPSLSAGRVQSVAVKLIVDRENEITSFESKGYFRIQGVFKSNNGILKSVLDKTIDSSEKTKELFNALADATFNVGDLQTKPANKFPSAPFTTSTLQQEASLKLGFSVSRTMRVAQNLYESGKITYMRTDSVNLSDTAIDSAKEAIIQSYGEKYSNPKKYTTKNSNAQEAHEAIRPSDFKINQVVADADQEKLYELIWKRAIASQMSMAKLERTTIKISNTKVSDKFIAKGEVIVFDGFLKVYLESAIEEEENDSSDDSILPSVTVGEELDRDILVATQKFSRAPSRFMEASLVKKLEELGIGRPSTYAPTITTIQNRGYVEKKEKQGKEREYEVISLKTNQVVSENKTEITGKEKNKLSPTDIGMLVTEFLNNNFSKIMDYNFTARIEEEFDEIAKGMKSWTEMIKEFYKPFHETVDQTLEHSERVTGERALGIDPKSGRDVIVRMGKFGPMVQIGNEEKDNKKPVFASLREEHSIGTITLEDALELFKLPRVLGSFEEQDVKANIGRFGPYVQLGRLFASIPKEEDPMTIELDRAIELIIEKRKEDASRILKTFPDREDVFVLNGKWGPYIKIGRKNFKIPKGTEIESLTLEKCIEISNQPPSSRKKAAKKKK
ncbi:MAG: type I DNA topoisomerase [Crocinitomicaceae bacterium]|nr:type I DNA topoisomerase [Crocinitomicaceae bacterium]